MEGIEERKGGANEVRSGESGEARGKDRQRRRKVRSRDWRQTRRWNKAGGAKGNE